MKSKTIGIIAVFIFVFVSTGLAFAAGPMGSSFFKQGQSAFKSGQYERALSLFKQAEKTGLKKSSLYYNIGVCSYRLKRYPQAKSAFKKVIALNKDMAPLAHYNLGLVAMQQGKKKEMTRAFETAMATTKDANIRDMAATALKRKTVPAVSSGSTEKRSFSYAEVSAGYDDNIELYSDLLGTEGDGDLFTELFAAGSKGFNGGTLNQGYQLFGSIYYQKFTDFTQYDLGSANVGLRYLYRVGKWQLQPELKYAYTIQDQKSYDQTPTFSFQGKHPFFWDTQVRLRYRVSYINIFDSTYDGLEGLRNRFRAELVKGWKKTRLTFRYALELNDRDDANLSPTRRTFTTKIRHKVMDNLTATGIIAFRSSNYDTTTGIDRNEDRWKTTLRALYQINPKWAVTADYSYTNNSDNAENERYNYIRNVTALRLERAF